MTHFWTPFWRGLEDDKGKIPSEKTPKNGPFLGVCEKCTFSEKVGFFLSGFEQVFAKPVHQRVRHLEKVDPTF